MESLATLAIFAIIVQFAVERFKPFIPEGTSAWLTPLIAMAFGIIISFCTQTGLLTALGITVNPLWIDFILTGIAYSGGAVAFNELVKLIKELRPGNQ